MHLNFVTQPFKFFQCFSEFNSNIKWKTCLQTTDSHRSRNCRQSTRGNCTGRATTRTEGGASRSTWPATAATSSRSTWAPTWPMTCSRSNPSTAKLPPTTLIGTLVAQHICTALFFSIWYLLWLSNRLFKCEHFVLDHKLHFEEQIKICISFIVELNFCTTYSFVENRKKEKRKNYNQPLK